MTRFAFFLNDRCISEYLLFVADCLGPESKIFGQKSTYSKYFVTSIPKSMSQNVSDFFQLGIIVYEHILC